jgi:hypothetical protein
MPLKTIGKLKIFGPSPQPRTKYFIKPKKYPVPEADQSSPYHPILPLDPF